MNSIEICRQLLQKIYGYDEFRPGQEEIIISALEGRDSLVIMPTGSGKSLCYQIPALVKQGVCVVVSPLIALMQDQVSALSQLGVSAAFLNSTLEPRFQREVLDDLRSGRLDLAVHRTGEIDGASYVSAISETRNQYVCDRRGALCIAVGT